MRPSLMLSDNLGAKLNAKKSHWFWDWVPLAPDSSLPRLPFSQRERPCTPIFLSSPLRQLQMEWIEILLQSQPCRGWQRGVEVN